MEEHSAFTRKDLRHCLALALVTIVFSLRTGDMPEAVIITVRHVAAYFIYGFALVFIFIALLKKAGMAEKFFEQKPDRVRLVKWAIGVSAFLAVYQMVHELIEVLLA